MSNEIRIQPPAEQIVRGKPMTVSVTVMLDKPVKVRGIHAKFQGVEETKADYTTTTTDGKGNTKTETHTAVQHVDITSQVQLMSGNERLGFFGNLSDAVATIFGGGKHETLPAGEYPFEIEIAIPEDAPPTHVGKKTRVFYELSVQVDIPLGFDLKAVQSFHVVALPGNKDLNPVVTRYPDDEGRGFFDSLFAPDVKMEMALASDKSYLGEAIEGFFSVETAKPLNCDEIRVRLIGIENSKAHGHTDRHVHQEEAKLLSTPNVISGMYKQEFTLAAETTAPLSAKGEFFSIDWFVQVELDVPWAKDPKIRAPFELLPA